MLNIISKPVKKKDYVFEIASQSFLLIAAI